MTRKTGQQNEKNKTSNWKEGTNLTVQVEELSEERKLDNVELFILTYNQVLEGCFFKGHSNSQELNELMLIMRLVDMETCCILNVIHVAGTIMKLSGVYGLSRGYFLEGMMTSKNPLEFILLNYSPGERSGGGWVVNGITSW